MKEKVLVLDPTYHQEKGPLYYQVQDKGLKGCVKDYTFSYV